MATKLVKTNSKNIVLWRWNHKWLLGYRCIARSVDERTFIMSTVPGYCGVGNSVTLLYTESGVLPSLSLQAMMSSLTFDYAVRQKVGGINMNTFFVKQFPVLSPEQIDENDPHIR